MMSSSSPESNKSFQNNISLHLIDPRQLQRDFIKSQSVLALCQKRHSDSQIRCTALENELKSVKQQNKMLESCNQSSKAYIDCLNQLVAAKDQLLEAKEKERAEYWSKVDSMSVQIETLTTQKIDQECRHQISMEKVVSDHSARILNLNTKVKELRKEKLSLEEEFNDKMEKVMAEKLVLEKQVTAHQVSITQQVSEEKQVSEGQLDDEISRLKIEKFIVEVELRNENLKLEHEKLHVETLLKSEIDILKMLYLSKDEKEEKILEDFKVGDLLPEDQETAIGQLFYLAADSRRTVVYRAISDSSSMATVAVQCQLENMSCIGRGNTWHNAKLDASTHLLQLIEQQRRHYTLQDSKKNPIQYVSGKLPPIREEIDGVMVETGGIINVKPMKDGSDLWISIAKYGDVKAAFKASNKDDAKFYAALLLLGKLEILI